MDLPFKVDQLGVQRTFAITHCEQITRRLNAIKNPANNEEHRKQSQQVCEDFKENFPLCLTCGLMLSEKTRPAFVRLFGLQIVEHVVKVRWSTMTSYEREYLKRKIMFLISTGTHSILQEQTHIKDVFASIVVEMIKHDWPHDWTDMLVEMERLYSQGEIQAQLTMLILLRLGEDVKGFQTTTPERRCDIMHTLTKKSSQILSLMLGILQIHGLRYRCLNGVNGHQFLKAQSSGCVVIAALKALAHYLDWVAVWHITYKDCKLLERVRHFLGDPKIGMEMQLQAANCFLIAVNRVSKLKVKSLMVLFGKEAMLNLLSAVQNADEKVFSEEQYALLKKLCQIVCALGILLCSLLGSNTGTATPATFGDYIDTLFTFTKHPSQFLCSSTQSTWRAFFNHEVLSRNPLLLVMLRKYLSATMTNLEKLGFPSKNDKYSCIDFASDETFIPFFTTYRDEQREVIKAACRLDPRLCFQMASECLKSRLSTPVNIGPINFITVEGQSYNTSPFFIRLDAKNFFFESIISEVFQVQEGIPVNDGVELLKLVLDMETNDPLLLFYVIANISMLCPFLKYRNTYCPQVLTKLFTVIEGIKRPRYADLKMVIKQVPGIMECYLEKFDEDILESTHCEQDTKKRKSYLEDQKKTFNCLIQGCFKKPLDVKHSKEVNINAPTDHSPPLKKSRGHSPPPVTSEDHSPPSMKPCDPSHSSVKPDYYSSSSVKPGHYSPPSLKPEDPSAPSNEWTTLEPVEDEPMVSMEDDGD